MVPCWAIQGEEKMKRSILVVLVLLVGLVLTLPEVSDARRGGGGFGGGGRGFRGGGYRYHGGYYGWYGPRVLVAPGFVTPYYYGSPYYAYPPPYAVPPPDVYASPPPPPPAYAYPNPAVSGQYRNPEPANDPGEWITVPGQWVNGTWVNEHQVRVPRQ